jgi:hypothetical protein
MTRFSKLATALAVVPVVAFASPVLADSPGQLTGGPDTYMVKNLTKNGNYVNEVSPVCNDQLQFSIRLHNAAFGGLTNVQVSANLVSGKMTAVPAEGASQGTSDTVIVNLPSGGSLAYKSGTTILYDSNGNVIKNLPDGITTVGVNVGDIAGSTTRFVNFKANVACPPAPKPEPPKVKFACDALDVTKVSRTRFDFVARASVTNATVQNYVFTTKDANGNVVDAKTVTTSALSANYTFERDVVGTYTVTVVVNTDKGSVGVVAVCTKKVTVEAAPPVQGAVTPPPAQQPLPVPPAWPVCLPALARWVLPVITSTDVSATKDKIKKLFAWGRFIRPLARRNL